MSDNSINSSPQSVSMIRDVWMHRQYFLDLWKQKDITALICQRKTKDITQLCLESLLRYYPDLPILCVDGDSRDDSTLYCKWMAVKHPNIKLWIRPVPAGSKHSSHGVTMDEALCFHISTKYVLLLDSDTITERGGWIEEMLSEFNNDNLFALGSLMLMSRKKEAILWATEPDDVLRYAHPSCSMIDREKYLAIRQTFTDWPDGQHISNAAGDHGSPLVWTMMGAADLGYRVEYYPVDKYVSHLSGSSWCEPRTIWPDDHDVKLRPFVTFILDTYDHLIEQTINDYEIITRNKDGLNVAVVMHGSEPKKLIDNRNYSLRFNIRGEYLCDLYESKYPSAMGIDAVELAYKKAIELNNPLEFICGDMIFVRRDIWQKRECLKS